MFDIIKNSECILNDEENITLKDILETFQEFDDLIRECEEEEIEDCLEDCLEDYLFNEVIPGMEKLIDKFGIEEAY